MSIGLSLALLACIMVLAGVGLISHLLVKLDARKSLRQIKLDAHVGRWFGLAIHIDREAEQVAKPAPAEPGEPRAADLFKVDP
ncbi:hypothetical protein AMES_6893 [Amycolatopsis mediterranei S699]|uniref:Uncharacterized protein n=2 Tax=Amycolatopsis mediterranei TaxID=33910 RepID=A0A0H3DGC7_AMYMU|nr:hypothetical protein [Amycolatopsis mediterranei]ADJ48719.1 hypothetical protein AMED_7000 [Amycolatopsis mediterranei U32]AEK45654.1 hypothetical protein RAM_35905 [Amycolatopsis mediterranei S699]AFO80428.1 hypothetical protein AMES_6893 [Amycolatopsis mediterranei S699]AGT87556.1 hypothetical protein B737_6893 [Amycolatopsis mediterranei RB]KDO03934.1 hypothetical protein DV26_45445 [Amycolatopsis mediterranei]